MTDRPRIQAGLIGSDIQLSLSPALHEAEGRALGLVYSYELLDTDTRPGADLGSLLAEARDAGFSGLNITHPYKRAVIDHLEELSPDARALGAVNTVVFHRNVAAGHNTDWYGFQQSLRTGFPGAPLGRVVQLGAGGAGMAVAHALLTEGVGELVLLDIDPAAAHAAAETLRRRHPGRVVVAEDIGTAGAYVPTADGVVNATPLGMPAHPGTPIDPEMLSPRTWVHDIVYMPLVTEFLAAARARGCAAAGGERMAVHQAAEAFRLITGHAPDTGRMVAHLHQLIR